MFTLVNISGFFLRPTSWQLSGPWLVGGLRSRLWLVRSWSRDWLSGQAVSSSSLGQAGASCRWDHSFLQTRNYFSDCQKYSKYFENIFSKIEQSTRKNDFQKYVVNNPRAAGCREQLTNPRPCLTLLIRMRESFKPNKSLNGEPKLFRKYDWPFLIIIFKNYFRFQSLEYFSRDTMQMLNQWGLIWF